MKRLIHLVLLLVPQSARERQVDLERKVAEARSAVEADRQRLERLEKQLQEASKDAIRETVERARAGDASAVAEVLDALSTSGEAVEYARARAFRGADGKAVPGLNDGFAGAAPDLGCAEFGKPAPRYGPR